MLRVTSLFKLFNILIRTCTVKSKFIVVKCQTKPLMFENAIAIFERHYKSIETNLLVWNLIGMYLQNDNWAIHLISCIRY